MSLSANDYAMIGWNHLGMHWADAFDVAAGMGTGGSGGMGGGCLGGGSIVIDQPVGVLFRDPPVFANLRQGPK